MSKRNAFDPNDPRLPPDWRIVATDWRHRRGPDLDHTRCWACDRWDRKDKFHLLQVQTTPSQPPRPLALCEDRLACQFRRLL